MTAMPLMQLPGNVWRYGVAPFSLMTLVRQWCPTDSGFTFTQLVTGRVLLAN